MPSENAGGADFDQYEKQFVDAMRKHVRWQISSAKARGFTVKDLAAPEKAAETMVAAAPIAHPLDTIAGPFYDTDGLTTWLGISRQALHKRVEAGALLACRTAD